MTNFPNGVDTFQNPTATTTEDAAGLEHDVQHTNLNDAVLALQTLLLDPAGTATFKFVVLAGEVVPVLWDTGRQRYCPLVLNNGVLGVGAPI